MFRIMKLSKSRKALYSNLNTVKMRRRYGLFTVEGEKAVKDTLLYFEPEALLILNEKGLPYYELLINNLPEDVKVYEVSNSEMKELSYFSTPSSLIGVFKLPDDDQTDNLLDRTKLYLLLDGVRDPGNMGTIIRTCHWFGIFTIFASYDSVDCFNPKVVQSSMGSLGPVKVKYCNLIELIRQNKEMPVYGTLLNGNNIYTSSLTEHGFIVMGNEGVGISPELRSYITDGLTIPPATDNHGESLNVAIATGVVLSQFAAKSN